MPVNPIDYKGSISKSQDVRLFKQREISRCQIYDREMLIEQDKKAKGNVKKVRDSNKNEGLPNDVNKENNSNKGKSKSRDRKGGQGKGLKRKPKTRIGKRIDIKI